MSAEEQEEQTAILGFDRMPADWGIQVSMLGPGDEFGTRDCGGGDPFVVWRVATGDEVEQVEGGVASPPGAAQKFEFHASADSAIFSTMSENPMESQVEDSGGPPQEGVLVAIQVCIDQDGNLLGNEWMGTSEEPDLFGSYTVAESFAYNIERVSQVPPDAPGINETLNPLQSVGGQAVSTEEAAQREKEDEEGPDLQDQAAAFQAQQEQAGAAAQQQQTQQQQTQPAQEPSQGTDQGAAQEPQQGPGEAGGGDVGDVPESTDTGMWGEGDDGGGVGEGDIIRVENIGNVEDLDVDVYSLTDMREGESGATRTQRDVDVSEMDLGGMAEEMEEEINQAIEAAEQSDVSTTEATIEPTQEVEETAEPEPEDEFSQSDIDFADENYDTSDFSGFRSDCFSGDRFDVGECNELWTALKERGLTGGSGNDDGGDAGGGADGEDLGPSETGVAADISMEDRREAMDSIPLDFTHADAVVAVQPDCPGCEVFLNNEETQEAIEAGDLQVIEKSEPYWTDVLIASGQEATPALAFYDASQDLLVDEETAGARGLL